MRAFIPVVRFPHALWSADKAVWDAVHPGWWSLMERTFAGEQVFEDPPTQAPYMIVNIARLGDERRPRPGLSGTMDITPGRVHVIALTTWGAPIDLVRPGDQAAARAAHDWFNAHHGFAGGIPVDRDREVFGVGFRIQEVVDDAPDFGTLMLRVADMETTLRTGDAAARVRFQAEVRSLTLPPYSR